MREVCALRHLSLNTEKSYTHWLGRFGAFLKDKTLAFSDSASKMEAFLTRLALTGVSASTQNQAFNALLFFYRDVLKQNLGPVDALRAKQPVSVLQCPSREEVRQLLVAKTATANVTGSDGVTTNASARPQPQLAEARRHVPGHLLAGGSQDPARVSPVSTRGVQFGIGSVGVQISVGLAIQVRATLELREPDRFARRRLCHASS